MRGGYGAYPVAETIRSPLARLRDAFENVKRYCNLLCPVKGTLEDVFRQASSAHQSIYDRTVLYPRPVVYGLSTTVKNANFLQPLAHVIIDPPLSGPKEFEKFDPPVCAGLTDTQQHQIIPNAAFGGIRLDDIA